MGSSCCFVFFLHSGKPSMKYLSLATIFSIGRPYALGTIFLTSLDEAMGKYVTEEPYRRVGGALSFV